MRDIIQSVWVGPRLSVMEQLSIKSYLHHGHPFHLYVYQNTEGIPEGTTILDANQIVDSSRIFTYEGGGFGRKSYAGFADMFRYRLLLEKGNWWVDTDSICLKPFDFTDEYVISSEKNGSFEYVNCGNLKAPAGSEFYKWLVAQSENVDVKMAWGTIGPALMKRAVIRFSFQQYVKPPEVFCPVPYEWNCTSLLSENSVWKPTEASYAVHLWNEAWRAQNIDKDKNRHPNCLYEKLKRRYDVKSALPAFEAPLMLPIPEVHLPPPPPPPPPAFTSITNASVSDSLAPRCARHNMPGCAVCIERGWPFR